MNAKTATAALVVTVVAVRSIKSRRARRVEADFEQTQRTVDAMVARLEASRIIPIAE